MSSNEPDPIDYAVVDFLNGSSDHADIFADDGLTDQITLRIIDLDSRLRQDWPVAVCALRLSHGPSASTNAW
jgi:hypothetical protein